MNKTQFQDWLIGCKVRNQINRLARIPYSDASMLLEVYILQPVGIAKLNPSQYRAKGLNRLIDQELITKTGSKYTVTAKGLILINQALEKLPIIKKKLGLD